MPYVTTGRGYTNGMEESMIRKLDSLREKYPFLEEIIKQERYPLFYIEEKEISESILEKKCHDHGSEGPEAFDEDFYCISRGEIKDLAVLINPLTGEKRAKDPSPSIKEEISFQGINPDFLIKVRHLKYEIDYLPHDDITLTVYKNPNL